MTKAIPALVAACTVLAACGPSRSRIEAEATAALQKSIEKSQATMEKQTTVVVRLTWVIAVLTVVLVVIEVFNHITS